MAPHRFVGDVTDVTYDGTLTASDISSGNYSSTLTSVQDLSGNTVDTSDISGAVGDVQSGDLGGLANDIGSATGNSGVVLNAEKVVGTLNRDYQTASAVYQNVQSALAKTTGEYTQAVAEAKMQSFIGGLASSAAVLTAATGGVAAPFAAVIAAIAAVLEAVVAAAGVAYAGPGFCTTDPPHDPSPQGLPLWAHYISWANSAANQGSWSAGQDAPGSFEDTANRAIAFNRSLVDNCYSGLALPNPLVLSQLITAWNGTHAGPTRIITRQMGSGGFGTIPGYDPISYALEDTVGVTGKKAAFVINDGPAIAAPVKVVALRLVRAPDGSVSSVQIPVAAAAAPASITKKIVVGSAIAVGVGAAGLGVWALLSHQGFLTAAKGIFGGAIRLVNPIAASEESTTVQTLIFPRPRYSESRAKAWANAHDYVAYKTDVTPKSVRIRQRAPSNFKKGSFRTITLGKSGVRAVVGKLK